MSLKQKTLSGFRWGFVESLANQGIQLIIGIVLARLLSPKEFGLMGMVLIFTAISQILIDGGFSQALIRRRHCAPEDYSTAFYFNVALGVSCYVVLCILAGPISRFFGEPCLLLLIRLLSLDLVISSMGLVQRTLLTKNVNFKLQAKMSIISSVISGGIGISMACSGWGVWSLVSRTLSQTLIAVSLLWLWNTWRPKFSFRVKAFREIFGFGSKLLVSGILDTLSLNIYSMIIGKYFSVADLGYYTRASDFRNMLSTNLTAVVGRVSYPVLAMMQDDDDKLRIGYKKLIKGTMFISFVAMIGAIAIARALVLTLFGVKWEPMVPYLQLLCVVGMLYPLHALNLNILTVKGKSDMLLRLEVTKKILIVPAMIVGISFGIRMMIVAMIANSLIALWLNGRWSADLVNYPMREQIGDIMPSFLLAAAMGGVVFSIGCFLPCKPVLSLLIQTAVGSMFMIIVSRALRLDAYVEISEILLNSFSGQKNLT